MKKYTLLRARISKAIIIIIYSSFVGYLLGQSQTLSDWNYSVHETMFLPMTIAYFALPILSLIWLFYAIKSFKEPKHEGISKIHYIKNIGLVLSIISIVVFFNYESHNVLTSGVFKVEEKFYADKTYTIVIDDVKVKCSRNEYNLISENNEYLISFKWNDLDPDKGKMEYIDTIN